MTKTAVSPFQPSSDELKPTYPARTLFSHFRFSLAYRIGLNASSSTVRGQAKQLFKFQATDSAVPQPGMFYYSSDHSLEPIKAH